MTSSRQVTQIGLGHSATDTSLSKLNYEYGEWNGSAVDPLKNNGNLARQTITVPTIGSAIGFTAVQTYTFDSLDRLKSATELVGGNQTWKQAFLYDRFGNKNFDVPNTTTLGSCAVAVCNPTANPANNRFVGYGYDNAGNVTTDAEGKTCSYDAENRQITASGNNLSASYAYDGNGKRAKSFNAITNQTTIFVYDADGDLAAEYAINIPPPVNPTISYLTEDALGSPRVISNSFGEVKARRDFFPFGDEIYAGIGTRNTNQKYSSIADDTRKKFATYQRDTETGLDFAQSRYYSPIHGRFTSPDEFKGGPDELFDFEEDASDNPTFYADFENPQSLNKYQYTYNNPYKYNDPDGHCPPCAVGWAIVEAAATVYDVIDTVRTFRDRNATRAEKFAVAGGTLLGVVLPGGGYGTAAKSLVKASRREAAEAKVTKAANGVKPRGSRNPVVAKAAAKGRQEHKKFADKVKLKRGWKSEKNVKDPVTGKTVRPDARSRRGKPVELKPNTPTGRKKGAKDLKKQESDTGKKGRVVYYEP
ncbi:MAG: RHS repeat-associated core domain-containing protein [Pyrinomonadaceae bacterium]